MTGGAYAGDRGLSYGGDRGGQYGYLQRGPRLDLTKPGAIGASLSTDAIISITVSFEHTALSELTVELPPFDGLDARTFTGGEMSYSVDGRLLFSAEINDHSVADDQTVTLSGYATEDQPLTQNEYEVQFDETLTEAAIEAFCESLLPYEVTVYPTPDRPLSNRLVQTMDAAGDFATTLQTGDDVEDDLELVRAFPASLTAVLPPDYVPTNHDTTPLQIRDDGITSTQTTIFAEVEQFVRPKSVNVDDPAASGGQATLFDTKGQTVGFNFGFLHDIPENWFNIAYRARIGNAGPEPFDRIEFKLDGQVLVEQFTRSAIDYFADEYRWYVARVTYDDVLSAADVESGDNPHRVEITKTEGDDEMFLDCIAFRDARFAFGAALNEQVDANNALSGPALYPHGLPILFDAPAVGADISHINWTVDYDEPAPAGYPILTIPKTDTTRFAGDTYSGPDTVVLTEQHDIPDGETVVKVYGGTNIGAYTDPTRTTTPTEQTESQIVDAAEMRIDGREVSVLADEREFTGTPLSILQELHEHANRRFVIEHGVGEPSQASFESFVTGDETVLAGESDSWIITDQSHEVTDPGVTNQVRVIGSRAPTGQFYLGVARDEAAIAQLDARTPESDSGVRPVTLVDRSLTSDNDCLSRARSELAQRSRLQIGGDLETTPMLLPPGYPYRIKAFDATDLADDEIGYGQNYGQLYGVGSLGVTSSLETSSYSESAGSATTSLAFERPSGLFRAIEEIATADLDDRPQLDRTVVPTVSTSSAFPAPPPDDGGDGGGGTEPPPAPTNEPPVAAFTVSDTTVQTGVDVTFDATGSSDPDGTIQTYDWDFGDGTTATGQTVVHAYQTDGTFDVVLTVVDNDGGSDTASETMSVTQSTQNAIAYLDPDNPLSDADYRVGGSAGPGTHGGDHVSRPAAMPTKADADYVVRTYTDLQAALNTAGSGAIIYVDDDINIQPFEGYHLPNNLTLVAGFCDPARTENGGRGPILHNRGAPPHQRRHFITDSYVELWGVSLEGPEQQYFDPRDRPGATSDYYTTGIWTYGFNENGRNGSDVFMYGCEFRGWTVAGVEMGERTTETVAHIERCTYENNCMETLGYGIEQYNGHMDISLCYFNFNRHAISGFGYDTESYRVDDSMVGPDVISHTFDMHGLNQNLSTSSHRAGKFVDVYNCTFPWTNTDVYHQQGQEGVDIRGYPLETIEVHDNHFYHTQPPAGDGPGVEGDPYQQENIAEDHFVDFNASGNNFGKRLQQGKGCPLNAPVEPQ